jgi:hypothetical protein
VEVCLETNACVVVGVVSRQQRARAKSGGLMVSHRSTPDNNPHMICMVIIVGCWYRRSRNGSAPGVICAVSHTPSPFLVRYLYLILGCPFNTVC